MYLNSQQQQRKIRKITITWKLNLTVLDGSITKGGGEGGRGLITGILRYLNYSNSPLYVEVAP